MPGVASVGTRPTIGGIEPLLEVHLFDFDGDLYGRAIEVEFVRKLRDEEKFPSARCHGSTNEYRCRASTRGADLIGS